MINRSARAVKSHESSKKVAYATDIQKNEKAFDSGTKKIYRVPQIEGSLSDLQRAAASEKTQLFALRSHELNVPRKRPQHHANAEK